MLKAEAVKSQNFELAASYRDREKELSARLDEMKAEWDNMVESICTSSEQLLEAARTFDDDANVTINILNDANTDNVLLMIHNGEVMYDEVNQ